MVARQSLGPRSPSLTSEEVSAYLESEFKLLRVVARDLVPHDWHLRQDVFSVMVVRYMEVGTRYARMFDPKKTKEGQLWPYLKSWVVSTARKYLKAELRRGMTLGRGRKPKDYTPPSFASQDVLEGCS